MDLIAYHKASTFGQVYWPSESCLLFTKKSIAQKAPGSRLWYFVDNEDQFGQCLAGVYIVNQCMSLDGQFLIRGGGLPLTRPIPINDMPDVKSLLTDTWGLGLRKASSVVVDKLYEATVSAR